MQTLFYEKTSHSRILPLTKGIGLSDETHVLKCWLAEKHIIFHDTNACCLGRSASLVRNGRPFLAHRGPPRELYILCNRIEYEARSGPMWIGPGPYRGMPDTQDKKPD